VLPTANPSISRGANDPVLSGRSPDGSVETFELHEFDDSALGELREFEA
jgi:hypothetical protein